MEEKKQSHITDDLVERVKTYRLLATIAWLGVIVLLIIIKEIISSLLPDPPSITFMGVFAVIGLVSIIIMAIAYNWIAFRYWKCPYCIKQLPFELRVRWGITPKTEDYCPNCNKKLKND